MKLFSTSKAKKSVRELSEVEKIEIGELYEMDQEKPSRIAEIMGLPVQLVHRYVNMLHKRKQRAKTNTGTDELASAKQELALEQKRHELLILRERNALELEKLKLDIEIKRQDLLDDEDEALGVETLTGQEGELPSILTFLNNLLLKSPKENQIGATQPHPEQQQLNPSVEVERDLTDDEIYKLLERIKKTNPQEYNMAKTLPQKTVKTFIKSRYQFSDRTIDRALEILKNGSIKSTKQS